MDAMLRKALRKHRELRNQVEGMLLNDESGEVERQLRNFVAKRPCWISKQSVGKKARSSKKVLAFPDTGIDWVQVYDKLGMLDEFGEALNTLPREAKEGLWWVPVLKGVTPNKIVACFRKLGVDVYTYTNDLDGNVPTNDRDPANGSYTVNFRQTIEADPDQANKSAKMLAEEKVKGITLTERLLLELGFFLQTGDHLDKENVTLCTGSRHSDGHVPYVDWRVVYRKLSVDYYNADSRSSSLRARVAVS